MRMLWLAALFFKQIQTVLVVSKDGYQWGSGSHSTCKILEQKFTPLPVDFG